MTAAEQAAEHVTAEERAGVDPVVLYKKVARRLIPLLFLCYVLNYIDRVNIGYARLEFRESLDMSAAAFGFGVGIFFVGYILFEVPSNLLLQRIGARLTFARILILWGLVSSATMFVTTPFQFYVVRVLLGVAEAGFFPGVLYFLSCWFPSALRGRITSRFILAIAVCGMVSGPFSGWIMTSFADVGGLYGWQWLFLFEGIPPIIVGVLVFKYLDDKPDDAIWLTPAEKRIINASLAQEAGARDNPHGGSFWTSLRDPRLYALAAGYLSVTWAGSLINYWTPTIIKETGVNDTLTIGFMSSVPWAVGAVGMFIVNHNSDRKLERRWHVAGSVLCAALAIALLPAVSDNAVLSLGLLAVVSVGYLAALALFWSISTAYLPRGAVAGGLAFISSVGQFGNFVAPNVIGLTQEFTGNFAAAFYTLAALILTCATILLIGIPARVLHEQSLAG